MSCKMEGHVLVHACRLRPALKVDTEVAVVGKPVKDDTFRDRVGNFGQPFDGLP